MTGTVLGPFKADALPVAMRDVAALRVTVWAGVGVAPRAAADGLWLDEDDQTALHWVVLAQGALAGCARLTLDVSRVRPVLLASGFSTPVAMMERLALHESVRGRGLSRELDVRRIQAARERGASTVAVETHERRIPALERLGFQRVRQLNRDEVPLVPPPRLSLLGLRL